ncbi:MAG TPA: amidohydrolase family protein [Terriglobales bacterium]|nr:amidohydrolase family protein [Terriglobales bacterium]
MLRRFNLTLAFALLLSGTPVLARVIAIKAGKLVDPATGIVSNNQTILIDGAKIKAVGTSIPIPVGAQTIDLSKLTVLPGLIDSHTHMCLGYRLYGTSPGATNAQSIVQTSRSLLEAVFLASIENTTGYRALQGAANAKSMLEAGFTSIRDVGNAGNYADTDLRRAIEDGLVPGPTIINAGRIITPLGGQFPEILSPDRPGIGEPEYLYADTHDEMKKAIRQNILYGAKVIKIVVDDQPYLYSPEDIKFMVGEAGRAGLKVAAHCWTDKGARNAAEGGLASIEHGIHMTNDTLSLAKQNNVVLDATPFTKEMATVMGAPQWHTEFVDLLRRAYKLGVPMAFGSDLDLEIPGHTRGEMAAADVENYVEAGLPSQAVLQIWITNGARLLGIDKERGSIKPGMFADIIATPQNPLDDIHALEHVTFVMKNGNVVKSVD